MATPLSDLTDATDAERKRFLTARQDDEAAAREMLTAHIAWRKASLPLPASAKTLGWGLPNMASVLADSHRCRAGCRILLVHGAMYDSEAGSHDDYALGFAALFDQYLARDSDEKVTVLVDVRGGDGWPNPRPWSALPWLRVLARVLSANFPERLKRLVLFPVPWVASTAWTAASAFIDENTAAKVQLLSGPAARTEPIPAAIDEFVEASVVSECNAQRASRQGNWQQQLFVPPPPPVVEAIAAPAVEPSPPKKAVEAAATEPAAAPAAEVQQQTQDYGLAELELS